MHILVIGETLHNPALERAAGETGAEIRFLSSRKARRARLDETFDVLLAGADHGDHGDLTGAPVLGLCRLIIPLSGENIAAGITGLPAGEVERLNAYFAYGGPENLKNAFGRIRQLLGQEGPALPPPKPVPLDAIYTFDGALYASALDFFRGEGRRFPHYAGMLSYRGRWADGDLAVERAIAESLARRGIGIIAAYTDDSPDAALGTLPFEEAVARFFCVEGRPVIDLFINFQFLGTKAGGGQDMFARAAACFASLDVPVIRPAGLSRHTAEEWRGATRPYEGELPTNFIVPELQGMTDLVHVSCAEGEHRRVPFPERVERLTGRMESWLRLRTKSNEVKRVAIMLHNAPCSGVEATVGQATDLDAFQSAVDLLRRLQREGYAVRDIPADGEALRKLIFEKKAISDFRWTAAEDIAASGGVLHAMPESEYRTYYDTLSPAVRREMEDHWGSAPGEAMVLDGKLLITGIPFGNVLVMVQPKRGCYGAKCTGEVCKILQDPACPPTHQYLATYWYLRYHWQADAVIHLGTHGSLEYLPGKSCGLGGDCFPDIAIGDLVNLYPYNAAIVPQALIAKRRGYAVTFSYLPAPDMGLDGKQRRLLEQIDQYFAAQEQGNGQAELLRRDIETAAGNSPAAQAVFRREPDFDAALRELRALLRKTDARRRGGRRRAFGTPPDRQWVRDYIAELWRNDPAVSAVWQPAGDEVAQNAAMNRFIDSVLDEGPAGDGPLALLAEDVRAVAGGLGQAGNELDSLLHALSGGFTMPSRGGDAAVAGREILPTGRNLHGGEQDKVPTPAAYERGKQAAEDLLALYRQESGRLPDKIAMNMTSLDVTRTGGEQLGQFLALMGVRPVWSSAGRVDGLTCVPLAELGRPRVDVTARISSVMRDAWPDVLTLMDRAVRLAAGQDEPEEQNRVRANSDAIAREGEDATGRIFGGRPGTYTSAVGLALKASAWKGEEDLARYFIDSSSYLYGEDKQGVRAPGAFAANVRQVDATSDITSSRRADAIASSYSARVQGGFRLAAKALGSKRVIRQYMGESAGAGTVRVVPMADHVARAIEDTLLNDVWREQRMAEGYQGAADLMDRIQNLFDTQCVCENIPAATLDKVAERYLLDEEMRRWFREVNPYALEESGRRFLELDSRGKWNGDPAVLSRLRRAYLQAEGDLEDGVTGEGDIQAGNVEIVTHDGVDAWAERLKETDELIKKWKK